MAQYVNKVIFGSDVKIDLTEDTVTADTLLSGKTAHDKSGAIISGTCSYDADTSDATATADTIESGKIAYSKGNKITGTLSFRKLYTSTEEPTSSDGSTGDIWIVTS